MSVLRQARFFTTANALEQLPALEVPEIAFVGRSNAGKSTAINAIVDHKRLAFSSKTPGRTQHLNFFALDAPGVPEPTPIAFLVDLPGYGYAKLERAARSHWGALLGDYTQLRRQLTALVLIVDARRSVTDMDLELLDWFLPTGKPVHTLLTKADKLNRRDAQAALTAARFALSRYGPGHTAQLFSALSKAGVEEARTRVLALLGLAVASGDAALAEVHEPVRPAA